LNIFNDKNLQRGFSETRESELASRQRCIDRNIARNNSVAYWFNKASIFVTMTPVFFMFVAFFSSVL